MNPDDETLTVEPRKLFFAPAGTPLPGLSEDTEGWTEIGFTDAPIPEGDTSAEAFKSAQIALSNLVETSWTVHLTFQQLSARLMRVLFPRAPKKLRKQMKRRRTVVNKLIRQRHRDLQRRAQGIRR